MPDLQHITTQISADLLSLSWEERISRISDYGLTHIAFSTSLSYEDQAVTHAIATQNPDIGIFTLDTGRLFEDTYKTLQATQKKYPDIDIKAYYPEADKTQKMVSKQGINGFYDSIENRKNCCFVRKVEPLNRALEGVQIWISGLRHEHSDNRGDLPVAEYDAGKQIIKFYPVVDVESEALWAYIKTHDIPYNDLHNKGFPSIGCAPCTRSISAGEHPRAGRWWWENDDAQECGLHMVNGKLERIKKDNHAR